MSGDRKAVRARVRRMSASALQMEPPAAAGAGQAQPGKVNLEYVGFVRYVDRSITDGIYERIIAGELIPDSARKAYRAIHEDDSIELEPMLNAFSGSMGFIDFKQWDYETLPSTLYVAHIGVEPEFRRRGIGAKLMGEVERTALLRGATSVCLHTQLSRHEKLLPFYQRLGFEVVDTSVSCHKLWKNLRK